LDLRVGSQFLSAASGKAKYYMLAATASTTNMVSAPTLATKMKRPSGKAAIGPEVPEVTTLSVCKGLTGGSLFLSMTHTHTPEPLAAKRKRPFGETVEAEKAVPAPTGGDKT
jgi:hypothetical protein